MSKIPMRGSNSNTRTKNLEDFEDENPFDQAMRLLDQLWAARLIDHIARPIDKKVKEEHLLNFKKKIQTLHDKLKRIMNDSSQKTNSDKIGKSRNAVGSMPLKPRQYSKYIRGIQNRYNQVLIEGSYKYLRKVCFMLGLKYDAEAMQTMNIQRWASLCQNQKGQEACC